MSEEVKVETKEKPEVLVQYVVIQLADGRKGIFIGPALVTAVELATKPPLLKSIDFSLPKKREEDIVDNTKGASLVTSESK